jgi:hypothetical protein
MENVTEANRDQQQKPSRGKCFFCLFFGSATPCASPPPWPSIFSNYSFWVHHLVNQDDRQLLAHAMASDFSVAWQCLSKRTIAGANVTFGDFGDILGEDLASNFKHNLTLILCA